MCPRHRRRRRWCSGRRWWNGPPNGRAPIFVSIAGSDLLSEVWVDLLNGSAVFKFGKDWLMFVNSWLIDSLIDLMDWLIDWSIDFFMNLFTLHNTMEFICHSTLSIFSFPFERKKKEMFQFSVIRVFTYKKRGKNTFFYGFLSLFFFCFEIFF